MQKFKLNQIVAFKPFNKTYLGVVTHVEESLGREPRYHVDSPKTKARYIPESRVEEGNVYVICDGVVEELAVTNIVICPNCNDVSYETHVGLLDPEKVYHTHEEAFDVLMLMKCDVIHIKNNDNKYNYRFVEAEGNKITLQVEENVYITAHTKDLEPVFLLIQYFVQNISSYPFVSIVDVKVHKKIDETLAIRLVESGEIIACHESRVFKNYSDAELSILKSLRG